MARAVERVGALGLIVLCVSLAGAAGDQPGRVRTTLKVEGMHCDGCEATIIGTLERIEGETEAAADHERGLVEVVYRTRQLETGDLRAAIEKLGHTVVSMTTQPVEG